MAKGWKSADLDKLSKSSPKLHPTAGQTLSPTLLLPDQWFLAVDPHLRHMDCAVIEWGTERVLDVFTIPSQKGAKREELLVYWSAQAQSVGARIGNRLGLCVVEVPDYHRPESRNKGVQDLVSVTISASGFGVGMINRGTNLIFVEPREWKGSKKKAQTDAYVKIMAGAGELVPGVKTNQHQRDAIWMGLSWLKKQKTESLQ